MAFLLRKVRIARAHGHEYVALASALIVTQDYIVLGVASVFFFLFLLWEDH